jgi:hypothetical protein
MKQLFEQENSFVRSPLNSSIISIGGTQSTDRFFNNNNNNHLEKIDENL